MKLTLLTGESICFEGEPPFNNFAKKTQILIVPNEKDIKEREWDGDIGKSLLKLLRTTDKTLIKLN